MNLILEQSTVYLPLYIRDAVATDYERIILYCVKKEKSAVIQKDLIFSCCINYNTYPYFIGVIMQENIHVEYLQYDISISVINALSRGREMTK